MITHELELQASLMHFTAARSVGTVSYNAILCDGPRMCQHVPRSLCKHSLYNKKGRCLMRERQGEEVEEERVLQRIFDRIFVFF